MNAKIANAAQLRSLREKVMRKRVEAEAQVRDLNFQLVARTPRLRGAEGRQCRGGMPKV